MKDFNSIWLLPEVGMTTTSSVERDRWKNAGRQVVELVPKDDESVPGVSVTAIGDAVELKLESLNCNDENVFQKDGYYLCRVNQQWLLGTFTWDSGHWRFASTGGGLPILLDVIGGEGVQWQRIIHLPSLALS